MSLGLFYSLLLSIQTLANWLYQFTFPWAILTVQLLYNLTSTLISWIFFILNAIMGHAEIFLCVVLLMTNDVEHLFMRLVSICIFPLWIVLTSCPFLFYKAVFLRKHKNDFSSKHYLRFYPHIVKHFCCTVLWILSSVNNHVNTATIKIEYSLTVSVCYSYCKKGLWTRCPKIQNLFSHSSWG